ncbi:MAG: IS110 family transposase [Chloroflexi bacterium]|nr:IS110 family transposase [Chloroflexota bacterium]
MNETRERIEIGVEKSGEEFVKLSRDLKRAAQNLSRRNARYFIDQYYLIQDKRIRAASQVRECKAAGEPCELVDWMYDANRRLEAAAQVALREYVKQYKVGNWLLAQYGIGPVIAAAALAHLEIEGRPTVGAFWRFAGLDPTSVWKKKTKRPWNAQLKSIMAFKMGESFVKFHGREKCYYGHLWKKHKDKLWLQNMQGAFSKAATADVTSEKYDKKTQAIKWVRGDYSIEAVQAWLEVGKSEKPPEVNGSGVPMLPPAQIHARARRWTVKLFMSHLHEVMHWDWYGEAPPHPYIFEHPGGDKHVHLLAPPLWPGEYKGASLQEMK